MALFDKKGVAMNPSNPDEENDDQQETTSWGKRLAQWRDRLKLGPHHKMERFIVMFGATIATLLLLSAFSFVSHRADVAEHQSSQVMYTENFRFSLSDEKMVIEGVYGNKEHTDVMVLLRMQNPDNMSTNAANYELFITGEKRSLSFAPNVTFSLFGSTGYGIVRFQHDEAIPREIMDVTIRSNSTLSDQNGSGGSSDGDATDGSFAKYDQGRFYVNPGADDVTILDDMNAGETDPVHLYTALVAHRQDTEIREAIQEETDTLQQLLNRSQEYTNRLVAAGYEAPEAPWFIEGDYVNEDGVFVAAQQVAGAFPIDYTDYQLRDGYINQVMDDVSSFDTYMQHHEEAAQEVGKKEDKKEEVERVKTLAHEDGSTLELDTVTTGSSPSSQVAAKDATESLQNAWRSYLRSKSTLERDLMKDLLILDADVLTQASSYSTQPNAATFY